MLDSVTEQRPAPSLVYVGPIHPAEGPLLALSRRMPGLSCPRASVPWASGLWVWTGTSPQLSRASSLQTAHGGTSQPQSPRGNPHENRLSVYPRMSHWLCVCGDPRLLYSSCVRPTQTARGHLPSLDPQFNHIRKVPFDVQGHVHRFWARDWMPLGGRHPTDHRHRLQTPRDQRGTEGDHGEAFPVVGTEVGRRERSEQAGSGAPGLMPTQPGSFTRVISAEAPAGLCDGRSVPLSPCPRGELAATAASRRGLHGSTRPSRRELVLGNTRHREWALYKPRTRVILVQRNPRAPCSGAWWCTLQEEASRRLPDRGLGRPCSGAAVAPGRRGPEGWGRACPLCWVPDALRPHVASWREAPGLAPRVSCLDRAERVWVRDVWAAFGSCCLGARAPTVLRL